MLNWKIVVCCIFVTIGSIDCGNYLQAEGRNYFISYPQELSWYTAYRYCAYHDMYLIDVGDVGERNRVNTLLDHINRLYSRTNTNWWTSGTDLASQGKFYWAVNGQNFTYSDWLQGQPDNYKAAPTTEMDHCVYIRNGPDYKWSDGPCSSAKYFICRETLNQSSGQATKCTTAG